MDKVIQKITKESKEIFLKSSAEVGGMEYIDLCSIIRDRASRWYVFLDDDALNDIYFSIMAEVSPASLP